MANIRAHHRVEITRVAVRLQQLVVGVLRLAVLIVEEVALPQQEQGVFLQRRVGPAPRGRLELRRRLGILLLAEERFALAELLAGRSSRRGHSPSSSRSSSTSRPAPGRTSRSRYRRRPRLGLGRPAIDGTALAGTTGAGGGRIRCGAPGGEPSAGGRRRRTLGRDRQGRPPAGHAPGGISAGASTTYAGMPAAGATAEAGPLHRVGDDCVACGRILPAAATGGGGAIGRRRRGLGAEAAAARWRSRQGSRHAGQQSPKQDPVAVMTCATSLSWCFPRPRQRFRCRRAVGKSRTPQRRRGIGACEVFGPTGLTK